MLGICKILLFVTNFALGSKARKEAEKHILDVELDCPASPEF